MKKKKAAKAVQKKVKQARKAQPTAKMSQSDRRAVAMGFKRFPAAPAPTPDVSKASDVAKAVHGAGVPPAPVTPPPVPPTSGRAAVDWVAAGHKAWETRQRNLALRKLGGAPAATKPRVSSPPGGKPRVDLDEAAYIARVSEAIRLSTRPQELDRCAAFVGKDMGAGWIVIATDGMRALTRKGEKTAPSVGRAITKATPPAFGLELTAELELALRRLAKVAHMPTRKTATVTITIDRKQKHATLLADGVPPEVVPVTGQLAAGAFTCNLRWLLDGCGRGGRLGYDRQAHSQDPLVLDTIDGLRYVLMPIAGMAPAAKKAAAKSSAA